MIYLYWYLGIGVVVLAFVYGSHHLTKRKESDSLHELLEAVHPDRKKFSYRIFNNFVVPIIVAVVMVALWPVAAFMHAKWLSKKKEHDELPIEHKFSVEREHLLERMTVHEIESREVVVDPLRAAPEVPFGHLNSAWQGFLSRCSLGSELWSFVAQWKTSWGSKEIRRGYVIVDNGMPRDYFLTVLKDETEGLEITPAKSDDR